MARKQKTQKKKPKKTTLSFVYGYADHETPDAWMGASSREAAEDSARALVEAGEAEEGWICPGQYPDMGTFVPFVDRIIEDMEQMAFDNDCPDEVEPFEIKKGAEKALEKLLEAWARKYFKPRFWTAAGEPELVATKAKPVNASEMGDDE